MSLTGKILAALNLLAVVLFFVVAAADWGERRAWGYAYFRHELALEGLPLGAEERDVLTNLPRVQRLGKTTVDELFQGLGTPVQTQPDEVEEVHRRVRSTVESAGGDAAQRQKLAAILIPLVKDGSRRDALQERLQKGDIKALLGSDGPLERAFRAALSDKEVTVQDPARPGQPLVVDPYDWAFSEAADEGKGGPRDPDGRRQAIAHLLVNLPATEEQPTRALVVVGLRQYADEANRQAKALGSIATGAAARIEQALATDRATFIPRYERILRDLEVLRQRVEDRSAEVARANELRERHRLLVSGRQSDVTRLEGELAKAKETTQKALAALAGEQQLLFDSQQAVHTARVKNENLEKELRQRERAGAAQGGAR